MNIQREQARIDKMKALKIELLDMLGDLRPSETQKTIIRNIDKTVSEKETVLANMNKP